MTSDPHILYSAKLPRDGTASSQRNPPRAPVRGKRVSGRARPAHTTLPVSALWRELLVQLHGAGLLRTDQIVRLLRYLAAVHGQPVAAKALLRVAQRKLKQLSEAGIVRRVPLPILPGTGTPYTIYTLDGKAGFALVADHLGVPVRELGRPGGEEVSPLFMQHVLSIQQVRITLAEACLAQGVELVEWVDERILRKQPPARVTLTGEQGEPMQVVVIPDAVFRIRRTTPGTTAPGTTAKTLRVCLELDRATTLVRPSQWQVRSMRRKYVAYQQLLTTGQPAPAWGRPFIVLTVTTSPSRAAHLRAVCEEVGDAHFWFTSLNALSADTLFKEPVWEVAGRGEGRHCLLPES